MRTPALLLTIVTGFTGLVYEITWQKGLAILLGSHSEATAAVLAIFLGGLSLGYALFGRVSSRATRRLASAVAARRRLLLVYGAVEVGIGLWALAWPHLFEAARLGSAALPTHSEAARFAFDLLLTALLIGPPTVLMGGTIPLLTQALARDLDDATRFHAFVYGTNTLGAFTGAIAAGFFLVPWLGIPGVLTVMGLVNLAAGAAFAALSRFGPAETGRLQRDEGGAASGSFALFAVVAALLGFAMMALQTVLIRVGGLALGASHFSFAVTVATFVLCIAVGSLAVSPWRRIPPWAVAACPIALGALMLALYAAVPLAPYAAHVVRVLFTSIDQAFYPYFAAASAGLLAVFLIPLALSGASLPLLFHSLRDEVEELGALAGRIYGWNTVGSLLGALLGGYVLLFWLDLHHVYRLATGAVLVAGALLWIRSAGGRPTRVGALAVLALAGLAALPPWNPMQMASGFFRYRSELDATWRGPGALLERIGALDLHYYDDDPTTTVAVIRYRHGDGTTLAITTNGKSDGALVPDYPTMALAGLLPCAMAERCASAYVIGLGTGVTAGELAELESIERVRVSEISPGVIDAAPLFDDGNRGASRSAKVEIVRSDAYRALLHEEASWDVIVSEPSNPWVAGVEMLFSREFLEAARARLAPGGVYAQWMHAYEMDDETLALVLRTYARVFENVAVWFAQSHDLLLLGFEDGASGPDLARIAERFARPDLHAGFARSGVSSLAELLAHELMPVGVVTPDAMPGAVHTLLRPRLSHQAARAFFAGGTAALPYVPRRAGADAPLLHRHRERSDEDAEELRARAVGGTCSSRPRECAVRLAHWLHVAPDSPRLEEVLAEQRARAAVAPHLDPSRLALLASLFADGPGRVGPEGTRRAIAHFFDYYHHAEPFRREALAKTWRSCLEPGCAALVSDARRRLSGSQREGVGYSRRP